MSASLMRRVNRLKLYSMGIPTDGSFIVPGYAAQDAANPGHPAESVFDGIARDASFFVPRFANKAPRTWGTRQNQITIP
jgi:hypothetical protein